jgi:DNA-binding transcriptional regulator YiaG
MRDNFHMHSVAASQASKNSPVFPNSRRKTRMLHVWELAGVALVAFNALEYMETALATVANEQPEETVGTRIRRARLAKGLTKRQLSRRLGYASVSTVDHLEKDRSDNPHDHTIIRIAEELDVTAVWILEGIGQGPKL